MVIEVWADRSPAQWRHEVFTQYDAITRMANYSLPAAQKVTLRVFNILGQEVATLVNELQQKGNYVSVFDANNLASGVYFYRLEAGQFTSVQKMLLLK